MFAHHHHDIQEEAKLEEMQRIWQGNRRNNSLLSTLFFDEANETEDILTLSRQGSNAWNNVCVPPPQEKQCGGEEVDVDNLDLQDVLVHAKEDQATSSKEPFTELDASELNDLPARYKICALSAHQFPVCGVYIDKRIIPGFKYKVRPLPVIGRKSTTNKCLFDGRALKLQSIGRGFARRITFESENGSLNSNDNYFYSDNRPEGYAFELELISVGDKFTIFDINHEAQGTVEILHLEGPQIEVSCSISSAHGIEKRANVKFTGKVEFYDIGVAKPVLMRGVAVALKGRGKPGAELTKVLNVFINKKRYHLVPGLQNSYRRVTVRGEDIGDIPTKYTMTGLQDYELPVVGTYVDPRVIPGFSYRVRPNNKKYHLFEGRALRLISIGMGYAKRLTFEPDSLNHPDNYLWSDNHPDGLGLEPRAVSKGMKFLVKTGDQIMGEATIFRDDKPQFEEKTDKIQTKAGVAIVKQIHVDVSCHIQLTRPGGKTSEQDCYLMRISGVALVRKEPKSNVAKVVEINNIGLDSELYILFQRMHADITFIPT